MNSSLVEIIGTDGVVRAMVDGQLVAVRRAAAEELRPSAAAPIAPDSAMHPPPPPPPAVHPADVLLVGLNDDQARAACHIKGVALLLGSPGAGKTRTIVQRIARLVRLGVQPSTILAMTFTRTAAREMNDRLDALQIRGARVGTIHSVCNQLLGGLPLLNGLSLDEHDKLRWSIKKLLAEMRKTNRVPRTGVDFGMVLRFISFAKAKGCGPINGDPFGLNARFDEPHNILAESMAPVTGLLASQLVDVYWEVEKLRTSQMLFNYDDMLSWAWQLLIADPSALERARATWKYIIVDEQQDSGPAQWDIGWLISGMASTVCADGWAMINHEHANFMAAGDISQSIFSFACGCPDMMQRLYQSPGTTTYRLPLNYRSTPHICATSTALVYGRPWHLIGEIKPVRTASAGGLASVTVEEWPSMEAEAAAAVAALKEAAFETAAGTYDFSECAILSRMAVGLHLVEIECIRQRIVYQKRAAGSFIDSKEIKDCLAYLRVACGVDGDGRWAKHVINTPFRYIGKATIEAAEKAAAEDGISVLDAVMQTRLAYRQKGDLERLCQLLRTLNGMAIDAEARTVTIQNGRDRPVGVHADGPADMIALMLRETCYLEELRREEGLSTMDESRVAVIGELQRIAAQFLSPLRFLAYIDAVTQAVKDAKKAGLSQKEGAKGALVLSTIHRSKGLEWKHVRVIDVAEGRFPHTHAEDSEEELRLLYVAISRAADTCVVSCVEGKGSDYISRVRRAAGEEH